MTDTSITPNEPILVAIDISKARHEVLSPCRPRSMMPFVASPVENMPAVPVQLGCAFSHRYS